MTNAQDELRMETRRWLKYAREDLRAAEAMLGLEEMLPRHVCWLAQQAAEKSLKEMSSATWFLLDSAVFCIILSIRTPVPINHCMGGMK